MRVGIRLFVCLAVLIPAGPARAEVRQVEAARPGYALVEAPAEAFPGLPFSVRIRLLDGRGRTFRRTPETTTIEAAGESRTLAPSAFRQGTASLPFVLGSAGTFPLTLRQGDHLLATSRPVKVWEDLLSRARRLELEPSSARAGETLTIRLTARDDSGEIIPNFALPSVRWEVEARGVSLRALAETTAPFRGGPVTLRFRPEGSGELDLKIIETGSGLAGEVRVVVAPGPFARYRIRWPDRIRAGVPAPFEITPLDSFGTRTDPPARGIRLGDPHEGRNRPTPIPAHVGIGGATPAGGAPSGDAETNSVVWLVWETPGRTDLTAVPDSAPAWIDLHRILRTGGERLELLFDAPPPLVEAFPSSEGLLLEANGARLDPSHPAGPIDFGDLRVEILRPMGPLRMRLTGPAIGTARLTREGNRVTLTLR